MELVFVAAALLAGGLFGNMSGWADLAKHFATDMQPPEATFTRQHAKVGAVYWSFCVTIVPMPEGLYMAVPSGNTMLSALGMFNRPSLLIPWDQFRGGEETKLYHMRAVCLHVGEPEITNITVYWRIYEAMAPYLTAEQ